MKLTYFLKLYKSKKNVFLLFFEHFASVFTLLKFLTLKNTIVPLVKLAVSVAAKIKPELQA